MVGSHSSLPAAGRSAIGALGTFASVNWKPPAVKSALANEYAKSGWKNPAALCLEESFLGLDRLHSCNVVAHDSLEISAGSGKDLTLTLVLGAGLDEANDALEFL